MLEKSEMLRLSCEICSRNFTIKVDKKGCKKYVSNDYTDLKQVFPYLTDDEIDLIETNVCKECL